MKSSSGFICGRANGYNGEEKLCKDCDLKLKAKWIREDLSKLEKLK